LSVLADEQWLELELEKIPENRAALKSRTADPQIPSLIQVTAAREIKNMKESRKVTERRRIGNLRINAIGRIRAREAAKTKDDEDELAARIAEDRVQNQAQDEIEAVLDTSPSQVALIERDHLQGEENTQMRNAVQKVHAQDHGIAVHHHLQVAQTAKRNARQKRSPTSLLQMFSLTSRN